MRPSKAICEWKIINEHGGRKDISSIIYTLLYENLYVKQALVEKGIIRK